MVEKENKKEEVAEYQLVQVPTQHTLAVQTPEGDIMSTEQALVEVLNKLDKLVKAIA